MEELAVVIPVYNEEGAIGEVLTNWVKELKRLNISFSIFAFNDGSKDQTSSIIRQKSQEFPQIKAIDQTNRGHGPTILGGYRMAAEQGYPWVFQIDGDNEMDAKDFEKLWSKRNDYDFLISSRANRESPLPRRIITLISRLTVWTFYGGPIKDVNSPYRLMRTSVFADTFKKIPTTTFAPNVIIAGMAGLKKARVYQSEAEFRSRKSGTVSIKKWKLLKAALKSFSQTIAFRKCC
jgi:dolichol-phosphate mannosyltransferase